MNNDSNDRPTLHTQPMGLDSEYFKEYDTYRAKYFNKNFGNEPTKETALQIVVTGHHFVEGYINKVLQIIFPKSSELLALNFETKLKILQSTGMYGAAMPVLKRFNTLRNKFAHKIDYKLKFSDLQNIDFNVPFIQYTHLQFENQPNDILIELVGIVMGLSQNLYIATSEAKTHNYIQFASEFKFLIDGEEF